MQNIAISVVTALLLLATGCAPAFLSGLTSEPMDATVFDVMSDENRGQFEAFEENPPVSMMVRYDQIYPDVTVTDPDLLRQMYDAITKIRITAKTNISKTDGYHCVLFTTADGKSYGLGFEHDLLSEDNYRYELDNAEEFWRLFRQIAEDGYEQFLESEE